MRNRLCALTLAAVAGGLAGCKIPYESLSVCTGLNPGDVLDVRIDAPAAPTGDPGIECDPLLGFSVGEEFSTTIVEAGKDGCGRTTGPVEVPGSGAVFAFDLDESRSVGDERTYSWVNASRVSMGDCQGDIVVSLDELSPQSIDKSSQGRLLVRYWPSVGDECIGLCNFAYDATITKRK